MPSSSPPASRAAPSRRSLFFGIILIGANLRAPITGLCAILPDIQQALRLSGAPAHDRVILFVGPNETFMRSSRAGCEGRRRLRYGNTS
jgi:hypothetical protein